MFAVLGATGKVGRATVGYLRDHNLPVRAIVRDLSRSVGLTEINCEVGIADIEDTDALTAALQGVKAVQVICPMDIHAADVSFRTETLVGSICRALVAARPESVVVISDYGAEVPAGTGVTLLFHQFESRLREVGGTLTILRSAEQMQNWVRHLKRVMDTGTLPSMHHPTTKLFPTISAADVGVISAQLLMTSVPSATPRIVYAEGPCRYTPCDVAAAMQAVLNREVKAIEFPRSDWLATLVRGGLGETYAKLVVELYDAHNAGKIDVDPKVTEIRRGTTCIQDAIAALYARLT